MTAQRLGIPARRQAPYGNILKFYAFALVVAIPLLEFRRRRGLVPTVLVGLAPWVAVFWLDRVPWPPPSSHVSYLTAMLVGRPVGRSWISLLHSQALVVSGMTIGWSLATGRERRSWAVFYRTLPTDTVRSLLRKAGLLRARHEQRLGRKMTATAVPLAEEAANE